MNLVVYIKLHFCLPPRTPPLFNTPTFPFSHPARFPTSQGHGQDLAHFELRYQQNQNRKSSLDNSSEDPSRASRAPVRFPSALALEKIQRGGRGSPSITKVTWVAKHFNDFERLDDTLVTLVAIESPHQQQTDSLRNDDFGHFRLY